MNEATSCQSGTFSPQIKHSKPWCDFSALKVAHLDKGALSDQHTSHDLILSFYFKYLLLLPRCIHKIPSNYLGKGEILTTIVEKCPLNLKIFAFEFLTRLVKRWEQKQNENRNTLASDVRMS